MEKRNKILTLMKNWPRGIVLLTKHLKELGISTQLQHHYHQAGWLKRIGKGAYLRGDDQGNILGAIHALQYQLGLKIHIAGKSALSLHGIEHYVSIEQGIIQIVGSPRTRLPFWFEDYWRGKFDFSCSSQFPNSIGLISYYEDKFPISISSPEKAFLEEFSRVHNSESFEYAAETFFLYSGWKLESLQKLLLSSKSMHANRLFSFLVENHSSESLKRIDLKDVSIGKNVIQYVKRGKFIRRHKIMVPEQYAEVEGNPF